MLWVENAVQHWCEPHSCSAQLRTDGLRGIDDVACSGDIDLERSGRAGGKHALSAPRKIPSPSRSAFPSTTVTPVRWWPSRLSATTNTSVPSISTNTVSQ